MKFNVVRSRPCNKNGYEVHITTMRGDADAYFHLKVGFFKEDEFDMLEDLVNVLESIGGHNEYYRKWDERYDNVPGWSKWFDEEWAFSQSENTEDEARAIQDKYYGKFGNYWDACEYTQRHDQLDEWKIVYHENGIEYPVEIER